MTPRAFVLALLLAVPLSAENPNGVCSVTKLTHLPEADAIASDDLVYVCQDGISKQATVEQLRVPLMVRKTVDEVLASDNTLTLDNELFVNVEEGAYFVEMFLTDSPNGSSGGMKVAIGGTAIASSVEGWVRKIFSADVSTVRITALNSSVSAVFANPVIDGNITIHATVVVSTAGTLGLSWAQNSSDINPTTLQAGSVLRVTRIDP